MTEIAAPIQGRPLIESSDSAARLSAHAPRNGLHHRGRQRHAVVHANPIGPTGKLRWRMLLAADRRGAEGKGLSLTTSPHAGPAGRCSSRVDGNHSLRTLGFQRWLRARANASGGAARLRFGLRLRVGDVGHRVPRRPSVAGRTLSGFALTPMLTRRFGSAMAITTSGS